MESSRPVASGSAPLLRWGLCLAGLGTILPLLGFLYGIAEMPLLALVLLGPAILCYAVACWRGGPDLRLRLGRGLAGGLLGVAGYDLIRVPIHLLGLNPFAAIQSYGVFLTGATHSSLGTDLAGLLYHTGNGIFFGMMFTLVVGPGRLTPLLAMIWAMVLEGFAVVTIFGEIYHLRENPLGMGLAFFAHLFYGAPLAWMAVQSSVRSWQWIAAVVSVLVALTSVFVLVRPPDGYRAPANSSELNAVEAGIHARWTVAGTGEPVTVIQNAGEAVTLEWPFTERPPEEIPDGATYRFSFEDPGIYQVRAQRTDWRSVFLIVKENGFLISKQNSPAP